MSPLQPLRTLQQRLADLRNHPVSRPYRVPGRWIHSTNAPAAVEISPLHAWHNVVSAILERPATPRDSGGESRGGAWSRNAVIYNLFVRSALAFDHNGDGVLNRPNSDNFNETGTFMKAILLLPYIQALGCNTVHLLPVTRIGQDGNKGDAGSPYAIRNPYQLDANLAEPVLGLGADAEFAAFVAAAHHLGIRVVLEFVFRTASKDADMIAGHPEWFYWIDANVPDRQAGSLDESAYGMPVFTPEEARTIIQGVANDDPDALLPPHATYRDMFLPVPPRDGLALRDGRWIATYPDGRRGRIPGAFADWPVDDTQPPWGDVTYLRLYDHPDFNYIAYNTIRMYDPALAVAENRVAPLWDYIINIIPHYQNNFGIDGAMIDMGHALPMALKQRLVETARTNDPDFAFWDENFSVTRKSVEEGYNAVMGGLLFILPKQGGLATWLDEQTGVDLPLPMFGTGENHNTPRAAARPGGTAYARHAIAVSAFLPTIPFLHSGAEFGEIVPVNTGLDFTLAEQARYPSETLPLFSARAYAWSQDDDGLLAWWQKTMALRSQYRAVLGDLRGETLARIDSQNPAIFTILRRTPDWSQKLALVVNSNLQTAQEAWLWLPTGRARLMDHYTGTFYNTSNAWIHVALPPGGTIWLEL
jgi:glycosidase